MISKKILGYLVLYILFFLPVIFLLFLYPATHHYTPLDIVNEDIIDLKHFSSFENDENIQFKDHITALCFSSSNPLDSRIMASNIKELVYDKFKGFKNFQIIMLVPNGSQDMVKKLEQEISPYEDLKYWHFIFGSQDDILKVSSSLKKSTSTNTEHLIYIIDKDVNQRGRIYDNDEKTKDDIKAPHLFAYDAMKVSEIKNKMNDDLRILFTEYRQKRKGNFNSDIRRLQDINKK